MTPRAEAEKAITAVLDRHRFRRHTGVQQRDGSVRKQPQGCDCWHWEGDETGHRAHVASVLADLMADVPILAPRPVPEEAIIAAQDEAIRDNWDTPATVPAPHAEAEADLQTALEEWRKQHNPRGIPHRTAAFIAGWEARGSDERG